jgi:hypothetical protein
MLKRRSDDTLNILRAGNIAGNAVNLSATRANLTERIFNIGGISPADKYPRARTCVCRRDRPSDATAAAGDQRHFAEQYLVCAACHR